MKLRTSSRRNSEAAFSLVENVLAASVVLIVTVANLAAIAFHRSASLKDREAATMADFAVHYVETVKKMPFDQVHAGHAIDGLFDGTGGGPDVRLPADTNWFTLGGDYEVFHPELVWMAKRGPEMRLMLSTNLVDGEPHSKHMRMELRWAAPSSATKNLGFYLDVIRVKDL